MLGQPVSMLIPRVVGFKLNGDLPEGATATDLVLTITEMLRKHGVVGKFVEFYGPGVSVLPLANRATIGNMSPEFGSTIAVFPIDEQTLDYLRLTGRSDDQLALVEAYAKEQGLWHDPQAEPRFSEKLELDLAHRGPLAGRPQAPAGPGARHRGGQRLRGRSRRLHRGRRRHRRGDAGRPDAHDRPRRGRDRGHHVLHQHLQPVGDDRGGAAGQEGRREGSRAQAVGQDHAGSRLEGGLRLLREGRPHAVPRQARLQPRRLRLHDLHRQLRPAHPRGVRRRQRGRPRGHLGAVGQPQLRGPDQPGREDELPGLAAARRGLRAGRLDDRRPVRGPARPGPGRQRRLPARHLADREGGRGRDRDRDHLRDVRRRLRRRVRRRRAVAVAADARGRHLRLGRGLDVRPEASLLRRDARRARAGHRHRGRPGAAQARRLGHHRPHQPRRRDQEGLAGRAVPRRARRGAARLQLLRLAPRQPRGDDPRHLRQHPAAQPARAGHRGRRHPGLHRERWRRHDGVRGVGEVPRRGHPAGRARRARSTAPARRATGRPRAPRCWASRRSSPSPTSASTGPT